MSGETNVQKALYERLTASPPLDLSGAAMPIYDEVPQTLDGLEPHFPHVTVGDITSETWQDKSAAGSRSAVIVHIWSRYQGRLEVRKAIDHVRNLLNNSTLAVDVHFTTLVAYIRSTVLQDPDGRTYHGICEFEILTHD